MLLVDSIDPGSSKTASVPDLANCLEKLSVFFLCDFPFGGQLPDNLPDKLSVKNPYKPTKKQRNSYATKVLDVHPLYLYRAYGPLLSLPLVSHKPMIPLGLIHVKHKFGHVGDVDFRIQTSESVSGAEILHRIKIQNQNIKIWMTGGKHWEKQHQTSYSLHPGSR